MKLNLGCGAKHLEDAINVDRVAEVHPDIVHDLNCTPWPFENDRFSEVLAFDVIEHCEDVVRVMEEIHRVSEPAAMIKITVPHFSCANAYIDPTHRHQFAWSSFDYFTDGHELAFYSRARFRLRSRQIIFYPTTLNKLVWRLANRRPEGYERRWAWMFPAWYLYFELLTVK